MSAHDWMRQKKGTEHFILCEWSEGSSEIAKIRSYAHNFDGKVQMTPLNVQDPKTGSSFKLIRCKVLKPCRKVSYVGRPKNENRNKR